jgi:hypothetical protein
MQTPKFKKTPSPYLTHATGCKHPRLKKTHHLILHMQQGATPKIKKNPSPDLTHATVCKHPRLKNLHHLISHIQQDASTQD